jgi:GTPase involved in cell partitioning and DNA repair
MRNIVVSLFFIGVVVGCSQPNKTNDYKSVRDEVMQYHDEVMKDQSVIVKNQMKLDTLLKDLEGLKVKYPNVDTLQEAIALKSLIGNLVKADDNMNNWMHQFEPDVSGKSNEDAIVYFQAEKKKISAIDSVYKVEIQTSNEYLKKFNK